MNGCQCKGAVVDKRGDGHLFCRKCGKDWPGEKEEKMGTFEKMMELNDECVKLREQIATLTAENERLREALDTILPMAKGYAAEHPVGRNKEIVNEVNALKEANDER